MSHHSQRIVFGAILIGVPCALLWWDHTSSKRYGLAALAALFASVSYLELASMMKLGNPSKWLGGLLVLVLPWWVLLEGNSPSLFQLAPVIVTALLSGPLLIVNLKGGETGRRSLFAARSAPLLGWVWIGAPLACLLEIAGPQGVGIHGVLWLLLVVKGNDSGAYLTGRKLGKTPLTSLSPKKTVEGAIGGLLLGTAIGFFYLQQVPFIEVGVAGALLLSILMGVCGQLGDLVESGVKRALGVKDSGALVPTYGGSLDMVDSLLLASPALLLTIKILEDTWSN